MEKGFPVGDLFGDENYEVRGGRGFEIHDDAFMQGGF